MKLKSIKAEAAACRKAFKDVKLGSLAVHCHHTKLFEMLDEPAENRIAYILSSKPTHEQALRLRLFRPITKKLLIKFPKFDKARAELDKASAEWGKASAELNKARAEWVKAGAELDKTYAKLDKARAELDKASAELDKARAEWDKACDEMSQSDLHKTFCKEKDCPWVGNTIFPDSEK